MKSKQRRDFHLKINASTDPRVPFVQLVRGKEKPHQSLVIIDKVRLIENDYMLVVNDGEREISFTSRKAGLRDDKATKLFKVLRVLWDQRSEIRNGKPVKLKNIMTGYMTLDNLKRNSESPTIGATRQIIKRLNGIFRQNGLAIKIKESKGKCKLEIKKGMV